MNIIIYVGIGIIVLMLLFFIIAVFRGTSEKGLEKMLTKTARVQNNFVNNNEEMLRDTANKMADINKDAVKTIAHSVKEGFEEDDLK